MWSKTEQITLTNGVTSSVTFVGTGTDDLTVSGRPAFAAARQYKVVVDSTSNTFKWSNDNGSTYEETGLACGVAFPTAYALRNAEGELEGISIRFGSVTGHVNADAWTFNTTGDVVSDAAATLGYGDVINSRSSDGLIIHGQYAKGTETGLQLRVLPMMRTASSSYANDISMPLDLGNGGLRHQQEYFEMTATANYTYRVNLLGVGAFRVTQISSGGTETGLFTCFADLYKVVG